MSESEVIRLESNDSIAVLKRFGFNINTISKKAKNPDDANFLRMWYKFFTRFEDSTHFPQHWAKFLEHSRVLEIENHFVHGRYEYDGEYWEAWSAEADSPLGPHFYYLVCDDFLLFLQEISDADPKGGVKTKDGSLRKKIIKLCEKNEDDPIVIDGILDDYIKQAIFAWKNGISNFKKIHFIHIDIGLR